MVELAPVVEPDSVVGAIAAALGVTPQAGATTLESIIDSCRRRRVLVLVDNCEHVVHAASAAVAAITSRCPAVTILATSREALGVVGEHVHHVVPLDGDEATTLFTERATASDSTFVLPMPTAPRWPSCATVWTAFRWPSNSPPPMCGR